MTLPGYLKPRIILRALTGFALVAAVVLSIPTWGRALMILFEGRRTCLDPVEPKFTEDEKTLIFESAALHNARDRSIRPFGAAPFFQREVHLLLERMLLCW